MQEKEKSLREQTPREFFEALPTELQYAAKYVAYGGQDLRGLFRTLAQVEETLSLDPSTEEGQEIIVRSYLEATNFGTPDEIEEEITGWKDMGNLESKANKFKPKLDAMQDQMVQQKLAQQEHLRKQQELQARAYMENVYNVLDKKELNGIQLDDRVQNMLYAGLVQPNYPSISGKQTNLLGHLLEKHQWVEPRHDLIAEALWLLADPDGYKSKLRESGEKAAVEKTVRKLKTAQSNLSSSTATEEPKSPAAKGKRTMQKPKRNFFAR